MSINFAISHVLLATTYTSCLSSTFLIYKLLKVVPSRWWWFPLIRIRRRYHLRWTRRSYSWSYSGNIRLCGLHWIHDLVLNKINQSLNNAFTKLLKALLKNETKVVKCCTTLLVCSVYHHADIIMKKKKKDNKEAIYTKNR